MNQEITQHKIGDKVLVTITSIVQFGAFADLVDGGSGLIHISEIDDKFIKNIEDYLPLGSTHEVIITKILDKPNTYALSLRNILRRKRQNIVKPKKPLTRKEYNKEVLEEYPFAPLEEKLDQFTNLEFSRLMGGK